MRFEIESYNDGWCIILWEGDNISGRWFWGHEDFGEGVGGEKLFSDILRVLGYGVDNRDVY